MENTKLKNLKYIIRGEENPVPGRDVIIGILIVPILMLACCVGIVLVSAFKEMIDDVHPRTVALSVMFVCLLLTITINIFRK